MRLERGAQPPASAIPESLPELRAAVAAWEKAALEAKQSDREMIRLERTGRAQAERADAEQLAAALVKREKDPGGRHVTKYERDLASARRAAAARAIVERDAWAQVQKMFDEHGAALQKQTEDQAAKLRTQYLAAVDELERRHAALSSALAWSTFFADPATTMGGGIFHPGGFAATIKAPEPNPLDDGLIGVGDVLEELRWVGAERPAPPTNPAAAREDGGQTPPQPRHRTLYEQGMTGGIGVPGQAVEAV